jgi:hypothetical protein
MDIPAILTKLSSRHTKVFKYRDEVLPLERIFALDGGLPLIVKRANLLSDFLFARKLSVALVSDSATLTGERVSIMAEQSLFVLVMLLYDVVEEFVATTPGNEIVLS